MSLSAQKYNLKNSKFFESRYKTPPHQIFLERPASEIYPADVQCVYQGQNGQGRIFVGNLEAAENIDSLKKHKITSVLTACKNVHIKHPKEHIPLALYIPGEDHPSFDLSVHFQTAIDFIHKSLKQTNILVHCMAGVSRSITLVLAYLMKHKNFSFEEAYSSVKSKRRIMNPNSGFVKQLKIFEEQIKNNRVCYTENTNQRQYAAPSRQSRSKYDMIQVTDPLYSEKRQKAFNPEFDHSNAKTMYNSLKNSFMKGSAFKDGDKKEVDERLKNILGNNQNYTYPTKNLRQSSYINLSKELDDRINKIRQKYYDTTTELTKGRSITTKLFENDLPERTKIIDEPNFRQKKYNNYLELDENQKVQPRIANNRSFVSKKDLLRSNLYTPYSKMRPMNEFYSKY